MKYTMRFRRHWIDGTEEYDSIDDACIEAFGMIEDNTAYPIDLVDEQGNVVMYRDEMFEKGKASFEGTL